VQVYLKLSVQQQTLQPIACSWLPPRPLNKHCPDRQLQGLTDTARHAEPATGPALSLTPRSQTDNYTVPTHMTHT